MEEILIWVSEVDNIYKKLCENNIDCSRFYEQIDIIGKKISNNKIGYFQFRSDDKYYKICVIPKIFADKENKRDVFVKYIIDYFNLLKIYPEISKHYVENNILDIIMNENENGNVDPMYVFLENKYLNALSIIKTFFRKYKVCSFREKDFSAQSIKYKLNLKKNVLELNKSIIHQTKREEFSYSILANITLKVLEYFLKYKIKHFTYKQDVKIQTLKTKNLINKKFKIEDYNFRIEELTSNKIKKYFSNKYEQILYQSLLILVGMEGYFYSENNNYNKKVANMISIAFEANNVFEYFVYDKLVKKYGKKNVFFIKYHRENLIKHYYLMENSDIKKEEKKLGKKRSEPDFLIKINEKKILCDAKWKVIDTFSDIETNDISKLYRDCKLRNIHTGMLIYPNVNFEIKEEMEYTLNYYNDFYFKIKECKLI